MSDRPAGTRHGGFSRPVEKPKDSRKALRRFFGLLRPQRRTLLGIFGLTLATTLFSIIGPKVLGTATDLIVHGMAHGEIDFAALTELLAILGVLYLASAGTGWLQQVLMAAVSQKVVTDLRTQVHSKLGRLPLPYYNNHSHGDVLSRVTNDVDLVATTLQQSVVQIVTSTLAVVGTLVMMLSISPLLTLVGLIVLPLVVVVVAAITKRSRKNFVDQQRTLGDLTGHVEETLSGHVEILAFGREDAVETQFAQRNESLYNAGRKAQFLSGLMMPVMSLVNNFGYIVVCIVGGFMAAAKTISVGDIQAFLMYLRQFGMPLAQTAGAANVFQSTLAASERVFELLDEAEELPDPKPAVGLPAPPAGALAIENLHFRYLPEKPLIEGFHLSVKPGQLIAIVGATGAGKTTLVHLLLRFYEIDAGTIRLDGVDIRTCTRSDLRSRFGMVLQDPWIFHGTIEENLAFGNPRASLSDIEKAAEAAHADHFIRTLPNGYQTELDSDAATLSSGQIQLLTIARALLANPAVLILDEATSWVDTRTERALQKAMKTLMHGRTSFVIAHRLSTIRDADIILVMDQGRVVEQGRHSELLAQKGVYAALNAAGEWTADSTALEQRAAP